MKKEIADRKRKMILGYILDDIDHLNHMQMGKVYKYIRSCVAGVPERDLEPESQDLAELQKNTGDQGETGGDTLSVV